MIEDALSDPHRLRSLLEEAAPMPDVWEFGVFEEDDWAFAFARSQETVDVWTEEEGRTHTLPLHEVRAYPRTGLETHAGCTVFARRYFPEDYGFKEKQFYGPNALSKAIRWSPSPPRRPVEPSQRLAWTPERYW